ncbi:hypothetical protein COOONC_23233 [Cooperia oncophora]
MFCPQLANFLSDICDSENPVEYFYRGEGSMRLLKAINEEGTNSTSLNIPFLSWDQSKLVADAIFDPDIAKDVAKMTTGRALKNLLELTKTGEYPGSKWEPTEEGSFSVLAVDEHGQAVSFGSSLGDKFGSRQFTSLGFFLNNAMGSFTYGTRPGSVESRNAPQPAKCPRTQMVANDCIQGRERWNSLLEEQTILSCAESLQMLCWIAERPMVSAPLYCPELRMAWN